VKIWKVSIRFSSINFEAIHPTIVSCSGGPEVPKEGLSGWTNEKCSDHAVSAATGANIEVSDGPVLLTLGKSYLPHW